MIRKKTFQHLEGVIDLSPLLVTTPEMKVCFKQFCEQTGYGPIERIDYADKFYEWYSQIESRRKVWIDNIHSGADKYRDKYLHPRIRKKVNSIGNGRSIIDFGMGTGEMVIPHLKSKQYYLGIDTSRYCLEYASRRFNVPILDDKMMVDNKKEKVFLGFGSLPNAIPIKGIDIFDEAIASMVLHHIKDYEIAIKSVMGLLHSRGNYFIATFNSDVRSVIEKGFERIFNRSSNVTVGDFRLPKGVLRNETIYFHENELLHRELRKYSSFIYTEECGKIFQIFAGIKK
jgi:ubiquinone/menaquinone biosynthesis C-methylase UbiE